MGVYSVVSTLKFKSLMSATKNMSSSQQHPAIIDDYLKKEVAFSNILGPFSSASVPSSPHQPFRDCPKEAPAWEMVPHN